MKRRGFLKLLGLAPVIAPVAVNAAGTMSTGYSNTAIAKNIAMNSALRDTLLYGTGMIKGPYAEGELLRHIPVNKTMTNEPLELFGKIIYRRILPYEVSDEA